MARIISGPGILLVLAKISLIIEPNEHSVGTMKKYQIRQQMLFLIAEQGLQNAPMAKLAKAANVAVGTIYHHYPSKEAIIADLYIESKKAFRAVIEDCYNPDLPYKAQFEKNWRGVYNFFIEQPLSFHFSQQVAHSPLITPELRAEGEKYYAGFVQFFQRGLDEGHLVGDDVQYLVEFNYAIVTKLAELQLIRGIAIGDAEIAMAVRFCWQAMQ
jgi:TetR/AcrR family transcriptional repressor of multidrug resistance operon